MLFTYHPGDEGGALVAALVLGAVSLGVYRLGWQGRARAAAALVLAGAMVAFLVVYRCAQVWS